MSPEQLQALLDKLCVELGFCLFPRQRALLPSGSETDPEELIDAIIRAEGMHPVSDVPRALRRQMRAIVLQHFLAVEGKEEHPLYEDDLPGLN